MKTINIRINKKSDDSKIDVFGFSFLERFEKQLVIPLCPEQIGERAQRREIFIFNK